MRFLVLWCAGILCPHWQLKRFHATCFLCRWRRAFYGKWKKPPYWISYVLPMKQKQRIMIDPRGHFTMLRCAAIITFLKLAMKAPKKLEGKFVTVCEIIANITIP